MDKIPILEEFITHELRKMLKPSGNVIHRETCPVCGKRLVNLYRYHAEWLCRTCRIAAIKMEERTHD